MTAALDSHLDDDLASSRHLSVQEWRRRSVRQRALDVAACALTAGTLLYGIGGAVLAVPVVAVVHAGTAVPSQRGNAADEGRP